MPHINTDPGQHDFTASALIFDTSGDEPTVILHKHKKLGKYIQYGGHVELNQNPWQTVLQEITEESGYESSQIRVLQPKNWLRKLTGETCHPQPVIMNTHKFKDPTIDHFHIDIVYAFVTDQKPNLAVGEGETDDTIRLTQEEISQFDPNDTYDPVREIALFTFELLKDWEAVSTNEFD